MDIQERADAIAVIGVKNKLKKSLRQPTGLPHMSVAECLEQLTDLLTAELTVSELARFAAGATYKANLHMAQADNFTEALSTLLESIKSDDSPQNLRKALTKLEKENPVVWVGVDLGQIIGRTLKASEAGKKSKGKIELVKAYATGLYDTGTWKSTRNARDQLWPQVLAEAKRVGWAVSLSEGPETLYKWLLEHKKYPVS